MYLHQIYTKREFNSQFTNKSSLMFKLLNKEIIVAHLAPPYSLHIDLNFVQPRGLAISYILKLNSRT